MEQVRILNKHLVNGFNTIVNPAGDLLEAIHVHPHTVTTTGFLFSIVSGLFFWKGFFFLGGVALILSGVCDVLDGRLARSTHQVSSFGAILDSTIDRYSEVAIYVGLAAYYNSIYVSSLIILAIAGSLLTSYARARAEGLGIECKIGLMQRPERMTFLAVGAIIGVPFDRALLSDRLLMKVALLAIAVLANVTVIQRVMHVRRKMNAE
jgi:CDP-diacylglycerol--glycerol-3-phosphate 3-phosphatidyltransferase